MVVELLEIEQLQRSDFIEAVLIDIDAFGDEL